jgi:hypothetical protein
LGTSFLIDTATKLPAFKKEKEDNEGSGAFPGHPGIRLLGLMAVDASDIHYPFRTSSSFSNTISTRPTAGGICEAFSDASEGTMFLS